MELTPDQIREIHRALASGQRNYADLAARYRVSRETIAAIARQRTRPPHPPDDDHSRPATNTGYWGVTATWDRTRFVAWVRHGGRTYHLGVFRHAVVAARRYDERARRLGFPPQMLNFPDDE